MPNRAQKNDDQSKKHHDKPKTKVDSPLGQQEEWLNLDELSMSLENSVGSNSVQNQATLLNNKQIPLVQRQNMASQMGRRFGNHHVQRVLLEQGGVSRTTPALNQYGHSQQMVQRVDETPVEQHTAAEILDMTLLDFSLFAQNQLGWFNNPDISDAERRRLRTLLGFANREFVLDGCADIKVGDFMGAGLIIGHVDINEARALEFQSYGRAVSDGALTSPTNDITVARQQGAEIKKLYSNAAIAAVLADNRANTLVIDNGSLEALITSNFIDAFVNYVTLCSPRIEGENGADIWSYINMRNEGQDPASYQGTSIAGHVKNFHRFERTALDRLIQNFDQVNLPNDQRKPLTLILHTAKDHNGAFHRDPFLTQVITNNNITAIMIEGKDTLADVQSEIAPLAAAYGKDNTIDQVMIAGHGDARSMELGGADGEDIDLDHNAAASNALFDEILRNMSDDPSIAPHRRIVFNACLTNSNEVSIPLDLSDDQVASRQVRDHLALSGSLATYMQQRIRDQGLSNITAVGANGSITQVRLLDASDGLTIISDNDPAVTADKLTYVKEGAEPLGVLRAVLESWAGMNASPDTDAGRAQMRQTCFQNMQDRVAASSPTEWDELIIHTFFKIILDRYRTNGEMIRRLSEPAGMLAELKHLGAIQVGHLVRAGLAPGGGVASEATNIFGALTSADRWSSSNWIPLVINQVWLKHEGAKRADFLTTLSSFDCQSAAQLLNINFLKPELPQLLTNPSSPGVGELVLAFRTIAEDSSESHTKTFLLNVIGTGNRRFPSSLNVGPILAGNPTEQTILIALGLLADPSAGGGSTVDQQANFDLDGDGTNETYITPLPDQRARAAERVAPYQQPDTSAPQISRQLWINQRLYIIGETGGFYALHNPWSAKEVVFVEKSSVTVTT